MHVAKPNASLFGLVAVVLFLSGCQGVGRSINPYAALGSPRIPSPSTNSYQANGQPLIQGQHQDASQVVPGATSGSQIMNAGTTGSVPAQPVGQGGNSSQPYYDPNQGYPSNSTNSVPATPTSNGSWRRVQRSQFNNTSTDAVRSGEVAQQTPATRDATWNRSDSSQGVRHAGYAEPIDVSVGSAMDAQDSSQDVSPAAFESTSSATQLQPMRTNDATGLRAPESSTRSMESQSLPTRRSDPGLPPPVFSGAGQTVANNVPPPSTGPPVFVVASTVPNPVTDQRANDQGWANEHATDYLVANSGPSLRWQTRSR